MKRRYKIASAWVVVIILMSLGLWQISLYYEVSHQKRLFLKRQHQLPMNLEVALRLPDPIFKSVFVFGKYLPLKKIILMNQYLHVYAGFNVYTPFLVAGTKKAILIDRGWVRTLHNNTFMFDQLLGKINTQVSGLLVLPKRRFYFGKTIVKQQDGLLYVREINLSLLEKQIGVPLYPYVLRLYPTILGGFTPNWPELAQKTNWQHAMLALHWFVLALLGVAFIFFLLKKK